MIEWISFSFSSSLSYSYSGAWDNVIITSHLTWGMKSISYSDRQGRRFLQLDLWINISFIINWAISFPPTAIGVYSGQQVWLFLDAPSKERFSRRTIPVLLEDRVSKADKALQQKCSRSKWIDHISMTEYVVNSSGWDHSPESSPFLFTFSFSLLQFPFLLESFDWHVSHHLIPSMTQVSFCTTMSIMFLMLLLNCFSGQSLLCTSSFYRWLFSSFSISVIIHFFDYRYESFHRTFPPAWPIMWKSIPSNRLILFRIPVHLPLICDYKSYTSICL